MKNLVLISLCLLLLSGCSLFLFKDLHMISRTPDERQDVLSWFQGDADRYLYQATIDIYGNHFSGLLIIKPFSEDSYRTLFITQLGIKIFDMEFFSGGDFKLHYCLDELNRRSIIKTLRNDISLMLENVSKTGRIKIMQEGQTGRMIIKFKGKTGVRYCLIDDKSNKINELIQTRCLLKKLNIRFYSSEGIEPDSISISNYINKLNIHLKKLNEIEP